MASAVSSTPTQARKSDAMILNSFVAPSYLTTVDKWLEFGEILLDETRFHTACSYLDQLLSSQSFLHHNNATLVDRLILSTLQDTGEKWEVLRKSGTHPNLACWHRKIVAWYTRDLSAYNLKARHLTSLSTDMKCKSSEKVIWTDFASLSDAKYGEVVVRFILNPSLHLHIGHVRLALLLRYFAERYQARVIVRIDDLIPSKEDNWNVDGLLRDINLLGIKHDDVTYTSDYFAQMMAMAESLILNGKAYVDDTPKEQLRKDVMDGVESKCRNNGLAKNMYLWKEMVEGSDIGRKCHLRGKLDVQDPNIYFRDPIYYCCNPVPHHRTGMKYNVYPTYDFACPFADATETISHNLCSTYLRKWIPLYYRVLEEMGFHRIHIYEYNQVCMAYTLLDAPQLRWLVDNGKVDGWGDPRLATVQGLVRQGVRIEALRLFFSIQSCYFMEWEKLWAINRRMIASSCISYTVVLDQNCVLLNMRYCPPAPDTTTYWIKIWLDIADKSLLSVGKILTLKGLGNVLIESTRADNGDFELRGVIEYLDDSLSITCKSSLPGGQNITLECGGNGLMKDRGIFEMTGVLNHPGESEYTELSWQWEIDDLVTINLVEYDHLITEKKVAKEEDFTDWLKQCTKKVRHAIGGAHMRDLKRGEMILLVRLGYFICDVPFVEASQPIVLIAIPGCGFNGY